MTTVEETRAALERIFNARSIAVVGASNERPAPPLSILG